jgi:polynucleotide 5'-hydroxyl-kinase GRC3/NOL9
MSPDWADTTAQQLISRGLLPAGICLLLGGIDTGKTTLALALAERLAENQRVGLVDADIGQSHIGPPTTVGWTVVDSPQADFSQLPTLGLSFVGHVTPVGHLLQLTAGLVQGVQHLSKLTELIIIDTPGFVAGPAAAALWWAIQQTVKPASILAVHRTDELMHILDGLRSFDCHLEEIACPADIRMKSPERRRKHRQRQFARYFGDSSTYEVNLSDVTVQSRGGQRGDLTARAVGLRDGKGNDLAIGMIDSVQESGAAVAIRAPQLDIRQVRCLVIGDVTVDIVGLPDA